MKNIDLLVTLTAHERDANNVTIALTVGLKAVEEGRDVVLLLLSDGVRLAQEGYLDRIDIGHPFKPAAVLMKDYLEKGGRVAVCNACMIHNNVSADSLLPQAEVVTADFITQALFASHRQLQLN